MSECVSCGKDADPKSERDFCAECDKAFEAGLKHQASVLKRAERLEKAKEAGDSNTVGEIMRDISIEAFEAEAKAGNK